MLCEKKGWMSILRSKSSLFGLKKSGVSVENEKHDFSIRNLNKVEQKGKREDLEDHRKIIQHLLLVFRDHTNSPFLWKVCHLHLQHLFWPVSWLPVLPVSFMILASTLVL